MSHRCEDSKGLSRGSKVLQNRTRVVTIMHNDSNSDSTKYEFEARVG